MAAPKTIPPRSTGLAGLNSSVPLVRAGMGAPEAREIEAWTDEDYRRATGLLTVLAANGQVDRQALPAFEPAALRGAFGAMLRARALDAAARELVKRERIGSYAETAGTEAAVVGALAALSPDDVVAPGRRDAGAALARGYPVAGLCAQLFGNAHDLAKGRRLPGCPALPRALNILPASSHGATQLPHRRRRGLGRQDAEEADRRARADGRQRGRRRGLPRRGQLRGGVSAAGDLRLHQRRQRRKESVARDLGDDRRARARLRDRWRARRRRRLPGGRRLRAERRRARPPGWRRHAHRGGGRGGGPAHPARRLARDREDSRRRLPGGAAPGGRRRAPCRARRRRVGRPSAAARAHRERAGQTSDALEEQLADLDRVRGKIVPARKPRRRLPASCVRV